MVADLCSKKKVMKKVVTELSRKWLDVQTRDRLSSGHDAVKMSVKNYYAM